MSDQRWVLAFDASCDMCREVSAAVKRASSGKLEVLPLADPDVRRWREQALGENAAWAPTLVRVRGEAEVRAWAGPSMAIPLARRLGPRSTVKVLQALGALRRAEPERAADNDAGMGRSQFLRLGAGAAAAAAILFAGKTPAFGSSERDAARAWVAANKDRLPSTYGELVDHPVAYRRAIFEELPVGAQSRVWVEHFEHWAQARPGLTARQAGIVAAAKEVASSEATFLPGPTPEVHRRLADIKAAAIREFGQRDAYALLATLGPAVSDDAAIMGTCTCNHFDNWCVNPPKCYKGLGGCTATDRGCGALYVYSCNGLCDY